MTAEFDWVTPEGVSSADVTRGTFLIFDDDERLWGSSEFVWTWVELLEWLNENWSTLTTDIAAFQETDENFPEFYTEHDFRHALQGALPSESFAVWFGDGSGWVESTAALRAYPSEKALGVLEAGGVESSAALQSYPTEELLGLLNSVGDQIASRLSTHSEDARAVVALEDWGSR